MRGSCWKWGVLILLLVIALGLPVLAQEVTAGIQGVVRDSSGAVVVKATVEVASPSLIGTRKVETDSVGKYWIQALPPGIFTLTVTAPGFRTYKQSGIALQVGRLPSLDVTLAVGAITEAVEVTGEAPLVDVTQSKVAVTVTAAELSALPHGSGFQSVIPFAPGARQEPMQSVRGQRDTGFQIDGATDSENVYMVNGLNVGNIQYGGMAGKNNGVVSNSFLSDFVQEVQIKSSSFEAEHGGATGGVINAIAKRGSNAWHGQVKSTFVFSGLNANDPCNVLGSPGTTMQGIRCNVISNPNSSIDTTARLDAAPEFYIPKKDQRRIITPGFELGGPLFTDRLWLFASYLPTLDVARRTVNFTGKNPGPQTFTQNFTAQNAYTRLDFRPINSLALFSSWNYGYSRITGALPNPDSAIGQKNTGAGTDPLSIRRDRGATNPANLFNFGADWTPTSNLVVAARWGYQYYDSQDRGVPTGTRYSYQTTVLSTSTGLNGALFPSSVVNTSGFANMSDNFQNLFDVWSRRSFNVDASYFVGHFLGTHTFKGGYFRMSQFNDTLSAYATARVDLFYNDVYNSPQTPEGIAACSALTAANGSCRGNWGYFTIHDGVDQTGKVTGTAQALYFQDAWTVGHGLTLNLGVRFDEENIPPYRSEFPTVHFGWMDKIAPRIGGAYDLFQNGKIKVYASYGKFFDIQKLGLTRGSFGSDYWHDCVYAMTDPNYTSITPSSPGGHSCGPDSGPSAGVTTGSFIENIDWRKTKANPLDPGYNSHTKPTLQHEYVAGVDWAVSQNWGVETRYSRKRLDRTIEDMSITDNLGYYIGNPGSTFGDVLHRPVILSGDTLSPALCPECPVYSNIGAIRRYDGVEVRLTRKPSKRWWGAISYTWSRLTGNYSGLVNTDITDATGGRHDPNNNRAFDLPTMWFDAGSGKATDGVLATDRPNTFKLFGYYNLPWFHQETLIGFQQVVYQGTPKSTCLPAVGGYSACQWAEGRGNWLDLHRDAATGDIVLDGIERGARTPAFTQTDLNISHSIKVSKTNEAQRIAFELNISNLFNQHAVVAVSESMFGISGQSVTLYRDARFAGDPKIDWNTMMRGYNYMDAINGRGAFALKPDGTAMPKLYLSSQYGMPWAFQSARNMRFSIKFVF